MTAAIHAVDLTRRYRGRDAVAGLTFEVPEGSLVALLGPNGAGKTTTIRMLMNIVRPTAGGATVLGVDSRRLGTTELRAIGHVSENQRLPSWMTAAQLLAFCRPLYPTWDERLCRRLIEQFDLPMETKISRLSRGMRTKAALVASLAYRPRLLVLDEPFGGLDPVTRDDLIRGVLELADEERWTVLISSHDLDEVERLVDAVAFIDSGRLVMTAPLAELHARFRRLEITLEEGVAGALPALPPRWTGVRISGRLVRVVDTHYEGDASVSEATAVFPGADVAVEPMTLREIFIAVARAEREKCQ